MNIYSLPAIIAFTLNFSVALIVLFDNPEAPLNRWFSAFIGSFVLWNISEIIILNGANIESALIGAQILYRIIFITPAFFVIIAYLFPRNFHPRTKNIYFRISLFALPILLLVLSFPNFQIQLVPLQKLPQSYYYQLHFSTGFTFILLVAVFFSYLTWGTIVLAKKLPRLRTTRQKNLSKLLLYGIVSIFFLFLLINTLRVFIRTEMSFYFLSTLLTLSISIFFLIAILQYRMFRLSRIVSSGITYSILSSVILAIYFITIESLSSTIRSFFGINSLLLNIMLILILVILIRPLANRIQSSVDRLLYKDIHQYRRNLAKFTRELLTYMEPEVFFSKIRNFLSKQFQLTNVLVFLRDNEDGNFRLFNPAEKSPEMKANSYLTRKLIVEKKVVEYYDLQLESVNTQLHDFFQEKRIRLLLPLIFEDALLGVLALSQRRHGQDFPEDALDIFTIFSNEIATAYHRNMIVDRIRREERQQMRLQHLASLGKLTAGVAHEIRNPLNVIATSAETLLRKRLNPEDETELKSFILEETTRLNRILEDFLNLSRLRSSNVQQVDIADLFNQIIAAIETATDQPVKISVEMQLAETSFFSDPDMLHQVLLNLGLNALEAIREKCRRQEHFHCSKGWIKFSAAKNSQNIILTVADNGVQIAPDQLEQIFEPFYTTKETGTGLGLSIAQNMVRALNGEIVVKSNEEFTAFSVYLPEHPEKENRWNKIS